MTTVSKSQLKAKMLEHFRRLEHTGEPILVTHHGEPVASIQPIKKHKPVAELFADWRQSGVQNDPAAIDAPTTDAWNLESRR